ncbi:helix-turn-helix domain-containing protein [Microbacterium sp. K36]|uniref:helix-turn-helix domain-containing protein n=1 Tax=Microbacterium sp. K36 TaxID=2305439 RepID=UPI00109C6BC2|nr:helix-turn-helix transcriptional regulator [Microbacterium sp. K36]
MAAQLAASLPEDVDAVLAVAARLTPEQRRGLSRLPWPLPSATVRAGIRGLASRDRLLLLTVVLALEEELEPILGAAGRSVEEVRASAAAPHLTIHAGSIRLTDPRAAAEVYEAASAAEVVLVHRRLADVAVARGDRSGAAWHRARSCAVRDRRAAVLLTACARHASDEGLIERALLLAGEAAAHATGALADEARVLAGCMALACGHAADAEAWLSGLFPGAAEHRRTRAVGPYLAARTIRHGLVPAVDPRRVVPGSATDATVWARSAGLVAILCAEHGDRVAARRWLAQVRHMNSHAAGADGPLHDALEGLCGLLAGDIVAGGTAGDPGVLGGVSAALHAACAGDIDAGLRLLRSGGLRGEGEVDPLFPGFESSPVLRAYRAVTEVLLLVWRGDIGHAREVLRRAAVELPVAIPFAGLGVVLARRLDLAVLGVLGPIARALTDVLPRAVALDVLVDRAVEAYLDGSFEAAVGAMGLWRDRGAPQPLFAVPGVDEVLLCSSGGHRPATVHPPESELAAALRQAVVGTSGGTWRTDQETLRVAASRLRSPFARGRVEALLGVRSGLHGDAASAHGHLAHAERLFEVAGARAWERAMRRRRERLEESMSAAEGSDGLRGCRSAWAQRLTPRELEVAMHAVGGTANRAIAERLSVSVRTVEVHLGRAFVKLDVRNRVELTVLAHRTEQFL